MFKSIIVLTLTVLLSGVISQSVITEDDGLEVPGNTVFPYSVYIELLDDDTLNFVDDCFGTLISSSWVITLAQCFQTNANTYRLHFGAVNFTLSQISLISRNYIPYPTFDPVLGADNLGLIQLPTALTLGATINAITLPWDMIDVNIAGMDVYLIGRRLIQNSASGNSHPVMRWNMVNVISDAVCDDLVNSRNGKMCTIGTATNPRQTPCNGLGYLVIHRNLQFVFVGVTSVNNCSTFVPNAFPRVTQYLDWISSVTGLTKFNST